MKTMHEVARVSPVTDTINVRMIEYDDADHEKWRRGELIQNCLGYLSVDDREFLMTGYTPEDWDFMFKDSVE